MKIGRNAPCPCGSGKKYKRCCGDAGTSAAGFRLPPEALRQMQLEMQRLEAKEYRRQLMQGLGRPIISLESHGFRLVAVGSEIRWSRAWRTFHDFLFDYIKVVLTTAWGNAELKKPDGECHPLITWYRKVCLYQQTHAIAGRGKLYTGRMTGVVKAYLGLAYDLYLCAHNADLPALLVKRLRNPATFEGALYETFVIGCFAKAGFVIEMEDEGDSNREHCEFVATHRVTGRKFAVEAKAITSSSARAGATTKPPRIRDKLYDALKKRVAHARIIFVELGRTQSMLANGEPDWAATVDEEVAQAENELTIVGQPAPPAYLFVTNRAFLHSLDGEECIEVGVAYGFKIDDFVPRCGFPSIIDAAQARDRHIEAHWLIKALGRHAEIPSTFDDRTPAEAFSADPITPLRIGDTYLVRDETGQEIPGVLSEAVVNEKERQAVGAYQLTDGRSVLCTVPLSEAEMAAYRTSPDTFFGVVRHVSVGIKTPLDAFDFFFDVYSKSSREKLLEFMANWPSCEARTNLSQHELAQIYSAHLATGLWHAMPPKTAGLRNE